MAPRARCDRACTGALGRFSGRGRESDEHSVPAARRDRQGASRPQRGYGAVVRRCSQTIWAMRTTALSRFTSLENLKLETSFPGPEASESSDGRTGTASCWSCFRRVHCRFLLWNAETTALTSISSRCSPESAKFESQPVLASGTPLLTRASDPSELHHGLL